MGFLRLEMWALPRDGEPYPLPEPPKWDVSPRDDEAGTLEFDYSRNGRYYDQLASIVDQDVDLDIEATLITDDGRSWSDIFIVDEADLDDIEESGVGSFGGLSLSALLDEVVIPYNPDGDHDNDEDEEGEEGGQGETELSGNAGEIFLPLLAAGQDRGCLVGVVPTFTATHDSNGVPWEHEAVLRLSPGQRYRAVLGTLRGYQLAAWRLDRHRQLHLVNVDLSEDGFGFGDDLTTGPNPLTLEYGRDLGDAPRKWRLRDAVTALLTSGKDGLYSEARDLAAEARRGRRVEAYHSFNNAANRDTLDALTQRRLGTMTRGKIEVSHKVALSEDGPTPLIDFVPGDRIFSATRHGVARRRVRQITVSGESHYATEAAATCGDLLEEAAVRQQEQLDAIAEGAAGIGTSEPPPASETGVPAAPTGLNIGSDAYLEGNDAYALARATWERVTRTVDDRPIAVAAYRAQWVPEAEYDPDGDDDLDGGWRTAGSTEAGQGIPGVSWTVAPNLRFYTRVRAVSRANIAGPWSAPVLHESVDYTTPPEIASAPDAYTWMRAIRIRWNGEAVGGGHIAIVSPRFAHAELHVSTTSNFDPVDPDDGNFQDGTGTFVTQLNGRSEWVMTDAPLGVTLFFRLVTVSRNGFKAEPGPQGSAAAESLVPDELFEGLVKEEHLAEAIIGRAHIKDLAVGNAQIERMEIGKLDAGELTVGMILSPGGGGIRAGVADGERTILDGTGLYGYGPDNTLRLRYRNSDGSFMAVGEWRTADSGRRIVSNWQGDNPSEMRFYPSTSNQYGRLVTLNSRSPVHTNQAGMTMKAFSPRADGQSGEVSVFPNYARMAWSNEVDAGPITSTFLVEAHQVGMAGPRANIASGLGTGQSDQGIVRIGAQQNGSWVQQSVLAVFGSGSGRNGNTKAGNMLRYSYLQYDTGVVSVVNDTTFININANRFIEHSEREAKTAIVPDPFDPLDVIRRVGWYRYRKIDETVPGQPNPDQLGVMVDEVPDVARFYNADHDAWGVDICGLLAIAWGALREQDAAITGLRAEVDELRGYGRRHLEVA